MKGRKVMNSNALFFGWNHPIAGRERDGAEFFQELTSYFDKLQKERTIQSYEAVLLNPHGGDLNGFFLLRGEDKKLGTLRTTKEWQTKMAHGMLCLEGSGIVRGVTGEEIEPRMKLWSETLAA
jgi:hypothetical protein